MKHYIIVKFHNSVNVEELIKPIKILFNNALDIKGVDNIEIYKSNIHLPNRHDLMIKMAMTKSALIEFDNSEIHKEWKQRYGGLIENKTIFDCE